MVSLLVSLGSPELALLSLAWRDTSSDLWMVAADVARPASCSRRHLGNVNGVGFSVGVTGAALRPLPFELAYDRLGDYDPVIVALSVLPVVVAGTVLLAKPPLIPG
jgi:hypothetical protein